MANKGFGNGRDFMDNGYGLFLNILEYELSDRGKYLVKADRWFPSGKICHSCGALHSEMKNPANRIMICDCGLTSRRFTIYKRTPKSPFIIQVIYLTNVSLLLIVNQQSHLIYLLFFFLQQIRQVREAPLRILPMQYLCLQCLLS